MVTRIHPEVNAVSEYNPFKDEKIIDLGLNNRMTIRQALIIAYNADMKDVIVLGHSDDGSGLIKIVSSEMSHGTMLMLCEKLKQAIMDREWASDEYDPEDTG